LAAVNLFLALFNMNPASNGWRAGAARAAGIAPRIRPLRPRSAATIGQGLALLSICWTFLDPMLISFAIFVYLAASPEAHSVALRSMVARHSGQGTA